MKTYEELKALIEKCGVHEQLGPFGNGWGIEQSSEEFARFWTSLDPEPKTVLEIGTGYRGGLACFLATVMGCQVTTVDIKEYAGTQTRLPGVRYIVLNDPGEQLTLDRLLTPPAETFDLVFLDAAHTYEAVKRDYEWYKQFGRTVAIHDIAGLRACEGVARFWQEISRLKSGKNKGKLRKGFHEIIAAGPQAAGIGWVVQK